MEDAIRGDNKIIDKIWDLEDKIHGIESSVGATLQSSEIRTGDRIDRLENRLEDKLSSVRTGEFKGVKNGTDDACTNVLSQMAAVAGSSQAIEKHLINVDDRIYSAEAAAVRGALATAALESQMGNLTSGFSTLADLTGSFAGQLDAIESSCSSGSSVHVEEYFDPLGSGKKEWRLAFRGTAYINVDIYPAYLYGTGIPSEVEAGCKQFNHSLPCGNHYRNRDVLENWANVDEVLFAIYVRGQMVKRVVFNGRGSDYVNWFEASRVIFSSWDDLKTLSHNQFSIKGHYKVRSFYINHKYGGCTNDAGWFAAPSVPQGSCPYEEIYAYPIFIYAPGRSVVKWPSPTVGHADAIGVFVKYYQ